MDDHEYEHPEDDGGEHHEDYEQNDGHGTHQEGEFEIDFENVNEDDDIDTLYKKLRASKRARIRADEDAKLLENRIKLLRQEETKARKKINETKKRAKDIVNTKKRNHDATKKKKDLQKKRENEANRRAIENERMRNSIQKRVKTTKQEYHKKRKEEADLLKQEKMEHKEMVEMFRQQEQLKNTSIKQMIRNREKEAEEKRKRDYAEKKAIARGNLDTKVLKENKRRMEHENHVSKMEQEELELIQRLQNTQLLQKAAYEDLEEALAGGDVDIEKLESLPNSGKKSKHSKRHY